MHREIQIKQFPIVTTHWWPKTRNERFVWENEQYLYSFLPLVHNHVQVIWVRTRIRCVTCVLCALAMSDVYAREITSGAFRRLRRLTPHSHGASASTPLVDFEWSDVKRCRTELWVHRVASLALLTAEVENFSTFQAPTEASANQIASCKYPIPFMQHQRSMWLVVVTMTARQHHASDTPSVKRWRRRPVWMQREPEHAHTHRTDRLERFDLKISKLDLLKKKDTYILDALGVSW